MHMACRSCPALEFRKTGEEEDWRRNKTGEERDFKLGNRKIGQEEEFRGDWRA
jgi:hypothetical protein